MESFTKRVCFILLGIGLLAATGCSSRFMSADPVVSDYRATVLTRGLVSDDGWMLQVSGIDQGRGIDHDHYRRVSHVRAGYRFIELKCINKFAYSMSWHVREQELLLLPKQCYVPMSRPAWQGGVCGVELVQVNCQLLERLREKEQPSFTLPAEHQGWVDTVRFD